MRNIISEIIFQGRIPFFPFWQKVFLFASVVPIIGIFVFPDNYRELGRFCFYLLILLLAIRPLANIFPDLRILRGLLPLRKEVGILCGSLGIAHGIGYIIISQGDFLNATLFDPNNHLLWGMVGFVCAILLTLTSNIFSMRLLKRNWKRLHRIVYIFFFATVAHIVLIRMGYEHTFWSSRVLEVFIPSAFLLFIWILSAMKFSFSFRKKS